MSEIATIGPQNFGELISKAVEGGSLDIVAKMMDLQDRHEAKLSKQSFDVALSNFKEKSPRIIKNKKGHNTKYADLAQIIDKATPILSQYGLSSRWDTSTDAEKSIVKVTCKLCHIDGHCEEVTMQEMYENSGSKNRIQSMASANTYLQRYTFMAITGLAAYGEDDDGAASGQHQLSIPTIQSLIMCGDALGVHLMHLDSQSSDEAMIQLGHDIKSGVGDGMKGSVSDRSAQLNEVGEKLLTLLATAVEDGDSEYVKKSVELMQTVTKKLLGKMQPEMSAIIKEIITDLTSKQAA